MLMCLLHNSTAKKNWKKKPPREKKMLSFWGEWPHIKNGNNFAVWCAVCGGAGAAADAMSELWYQCVCV